MLTGRIKAQLIVFAVLALVATSYLGAKYVGIDFLGRSYTVTASLPDGGGAFDNGEVTFRGIPVGRVEKLSATPDGVTAWLTIEGDAPEIPSDVRVQVANRSAIGEQYVNLVGGTPGSTALTAGDRLAAGPDAIPPPIDGVLRSGAELVDSLPKDALPSVIDEVYAATQGAGQNFQTLLTSSQRFQKIADQNLLVTKGLIESADTVLATQVEASDSIIAFSDDLNTIASTLEANDGELRQLIESAPAAARELDALFREVGQPLGVLLANLVTPAQVFGVNAAGVEDAVVQVPRAVSAGWYIAGTKGLRLSLTQSYFDPLPCTTGYEGTDLREGLDVEGDSEPFNLQAGCRSTNPESNVRGPKSTPSNLGAASTRVETADSLADLLGGGE